MDAITKPTRKPGARGSSLATPKPNQIPRPYPDLHDHVRALEKAGQLIRVTRPINKDTEMHRWCAGSSRRHRGEGPQGVPVHQCHRQQGRKTTSRCWSAGSPPTAIYRIGVNCPFEEIDARWVAAANSDPRASSPRAVPRHRHHRQGPRQARPGPRRSSAADLDAGLGVGPTPRCRSTSPRPRHRRAEYGQLPRPGEGAAAARHEPVAGAAPGIYNHWKAAPARFKNSLARWCSARRRCDLPRCRSFPRRSTNCTSPARWSATDQRGQGQDRRPAGAAEAEIVIEGFIDTEFLEPEAPFGESHGHVNLQEFNAFMDVTAITRRKSHPDSIISQVTPSESSLIKLIAWSRCSSLLRNTLGIKGIKKVSMHGR